MLRFETVQEPQNNRAIIPTPHLTILPSPLARNSRANQTTDCLYTHLTALSLPLFGARHLGQCKGRLFGKRTCTSPRLVPALQCARVAALRKRALCFGLFARARARRPKKVYHHTRGARVIIAPRASEMRRICARARIICMPARARFCKAYVRARGGLLRGSY